MSRGASRARGGKGTPPSALLPGTFLQDEQSTLQLLKKHLMTEQTVENYAETIAQLSRQCRSLLELGHADRWGPPLPSSPLPSPPPPHTDQVLSLPASRSAGGSPGWTGSMCP